MGLPIDKLILATNENNILQRFVHEGVYMPDKFYSTHSPSMDIQIASNFERYLYYLCDGNANETALRMERFKSEGKLVFSEAELQQIQKDFAAHSVNGEECLQTIQSYEGRYGYLLDPHSACGVAASEKFSKNEICVSLATAHPAKFDEAISLCGIKQTFPQAIEQLFDKPQRQVIVEHSKQEVVEQLEKFYRT
jgi:threonine synthase